MKKAFKKRIGTPNKALKKERNLLKKAFKKRIGTPNKAFGRIGTP